MTLINYPPPSMSQKVRLFLQKKSSDGDLSPHDRSEEVLDEVSKATLTIGRAGKADEEKAANKKSQPPGIRGTSRFVFTWSWMTGWLIIWSGKIEFLTWQKKYLHQNQNVMDLWWTILIWMFVLSLRPNMFALARPLQDCEPLRQKMVCAHCAGSLEALFLRRCSFEALYHCLSKQSSAIFRVSYFCPQKQSFTLSGST